MAGVDEGRDGTGIADSNDRDGRRLFGLERERLPKTGEEQRSGDSLEENHVETSLAMGGVSSIRKKVGRESTKNESR